MKRVALVTDGQQGIGYGIAEALVRADFSVALASRSAADTPAVVEALEHLGSAYQYFRRDLGEIGSVATLINQVEARLGPVTSLISNAGVSAKVRGDMLDLPPENFDFVLGVKLRGAYFLSQEVARRMAVQPSEPDRSIMFVTSVSASTVSIERAEYCISKAGAAMMAQLFAVRLAPLGIGVFELCPGIIETSMTAGVKEKYTARIEDGLVPAAHWGQPLAQGRFNFATGTVIPVDGGFSIPRL